MIDPGGSEQETVSQGNDGTRREAPCPNCGGPIEFKMGSAAAVVCPWCRFSVVRRGVALEAIGKVADLVPTTPAMGVGDRGSLRGRRFVVGGRIQLDHGRGPWDEWYVEFLDPGDGGSALGPASGSPAGAQGGRAPSAPAASDRGVLQGYVAGSERGGKPAGGPAERRQWGWLAYAQGHWYLTFPVPVDGAQLPAWDVMRPGQRGTLPGTGTVQWVVAEQGQSTVVSAEGELPFPPPPSGTRGRYVDLHGPGGEFATIDYGDGSEPPRLFAGERLAAQDVQIEGGGQRPVQKAEAARMRCPTCGGPVPIRVPEDAQRAVCPSCHSLLDYQAGQLRYLSKLEQARAEAIIPLGARGRLRGLDCLCIGMMERSVTFDGEDFRWQEYLLHTPVGYRWLLQDSGHWLWVEPVNPAEVVRRGMAPSYRGRDYKAFQFATSTVRFVVGEFYWQVKLGDTAQVEDYIAPPYVLSYERNEREETWSHGTYLEPEEVARGFGLPPQSLPPRQGVHPAQPNPVRRWPAAVLGVGTAALALLLFLAADASRAKYQILVASSFTPTSGTLQMPPLPDPDMQAIGAKRDEDAKRKGDPGAPPASPSVQPKRNDPRYAAVSVTPPFTIPKGSPGITVSLQTRDTQYAWVGAAVGLISQTSGETREFTLEVDRWRRSGGIGSDTRTLIGLEPGPYVLRVETRWAASSERAAASSGPIRASISVDALAAQDPSGTCFFCVLIFAFVPLILDWGRQSSFEKKRWENSAFQGSGGSSASSGEDESWSWLGDSGCGSGCGGDSGCGSGCGSDCGGGCGGGCGD